MKSTLFLGGGHITSALVAGLRLAKYKQPIVVYDHNPQKLRALRRQFHVDIAHDVKSAIEQAEFVIIAVRPVSVAGLLAEVTACHASRYPRLWISLAAGVPLRNLRAQFKQARWTRAMPSPVCRIESGLTALCFDGSVGKRERTRVRRFFSHVGQVLEIPERQFDAFTATYSSSHGYHALAMLAKSAQDAGLDRETALIAAAHALGDGIVYWRQSGQSLDDLLHEAATPGGIAAATTAAMDKSGYARVVADGLKAGIAQARRNARR
jgi:pyrroline-5-carboxylate reductase